MSRVPGLVAVQNVQCDLGYFCIVRIRIMAIISSMKSNALPNLLRCERSSALRFQTQSDDEVTSFIPNIWSEFP